MPEHAVRKESAEEHERAARHESTELCERVEEQEGTVMHERAVSLESTPGAERAAVEESTVEHERADVDERTDQDERAVTCERTDPAERAAGHEGAVNAERAEVYESTEVAERAVQGERAANVERAVMHESAARQERAMAPESTVVRERAIGDESAVQKERADYGESTVLEERAVLLERTAVDERALKCERTERGERAKEVEGTEDSERAEELERTESVERAATSERTEDLERPSAFLHALWGANPPGRITLWARHTRRSWCLRSWHGADVIARDRADVYTGAALVGRDLGAHARGGARDTVAIAGFWLDIDVNGGPDQKTGAAPDFLAAAAVASAHRDPTLVIHTGHGLHAWWLFDEPWRFESVPDRDRAALASAQWQELHRRAALGGGWTIDHTHDLARLMRLPGTLNGKGAEPRPVRTLIVGGPRYARGELLGLAEEVGLVPHALAVAAGGGASVHTVTAEPSGEEPVALVEALCLADDEFRLTWEHRRREQWSMSEYDLAIASRAAQASTVTDQQLADVIAYHRKLRGDGKGKATRIDYLRRTIAKARARAAHDAANRELERLAEQGRRAHG